MKYKYRLKTSYGAYKRFIRDLESKGFTASPTEIMSKKEFDKEYAEFKSRGRTNIARELAYSIPSIQYQKFRKAVERYKKKGYKVDMTVYDDITGEKREMRYSDFKRDFQLFKNIRANQKAKGLPTSNLSIAQEMAKGTLLFSPSFATDYADEEMIQHFIDLDPTLESKYRRGYDDEGQPIFNKTAFVKDIMKGEFSGASLFEEYMNTHDGYYYDENGMEHVKKSIREEFEAIY